MYLFSQLTARFVTRPSVDSPPPGAHAQWPDPDQPGAPALIEVPTVRRRVRSASEPGPPPLAARNVTPRASHHPAPAPT